MTDYFIWESRRRRADDAIVPEFSPTLKKYGVSFLTGRRFLNPLPELQVRIDRFGQGVLTDDLVIFKNRCLAHSHRLIKVLHDIGVDNIDYYPLRVINEVTGEVWQSHQAANILDVIYCIDEEKSDLYIDDENPYNLWFIDYLALLEERLGDSRCFRLGERLSTVIVHRDVKEAIEAAGITGPVFLPAEGYREYHGFSANNPHNVIGTHNEDPDGPADGINGGYQDEPEDEGEGIEDYK
jgi:hypothetical protein